MSKAIDSSRLLARLLVVLILSVLCGCATPQWYKGNTHTHTWWSDGDSPPEVVVNWYKDHGYNFLVLSDHDIMADRETWVSLRQHQVAVVKAYEAQYGAEGIEKRNRNGKTEYRLKTLAELRPRFDERSRFLLIPGEEIGISAPMHVHLNGINLIETIPSRQGKSVPETMQTNINAVLAQREKTGQPMLAHLNHPNYLWATRPEDYMYLRGKLLFEVYNGIGCVNNYGDELRPSAERIWDLVLTKRLGELALPVMYGIACDDTHFCFGPAEGKEVTTRHFWGQGNAGRGWIVVRAKSLTPADIVWAMERGDFYASTGVVLDDIRFRDDTFEIDIRPRSGVRYRTQFIGTRVGYDRTITTQPAVTTRPGDPENYYLNNYSSDIGQVLDEQIGIHAAYKMKGNEIYVRAKVISTAEHLNPYAEGGVEVAWVQPVQPGKVRDAAR